MMTEGTPPPRGWLYGFLLTITTFWSSGVFWDAWRDHRMGPVKLAGSVILLISIVLIAYEALTNDDYKTARVTIIARRLLLPLGGILFIIGSHL
jgi:hypothetical protein